LEQKQRIYSLDPILHSKIQVLVLGSMPGQQSLEKQQYYAHPRNQFWKILFSIFSQPETTDYNKRIALLQANRIGLWDVIHSCVRKGSLDANIKEERANDIATLLNTYKDIRFVAFNGGKAFQTFKKNIGLHVLDGIAYKQLPSTSPIPGRNIKSFDEKTKEWQVIRQYIDVPPALE
jgi:hypoxanthine-DNA glycosylase